MASMVFYLFSVVFFEVPSLAAAFMLISVLVACLVLVTDDVLAHVRLALLAPDHNSLRAPETTMYNSIIVIHSILRNSRRTASCGQLGVSQMYCYRNPSYLTVATPITIEACRWLQNR